MGDMTGDITSAAKKKLVTNRPSYAIDELYTV